MPDEQRGPDEEEAFPAGEGAPADGESSEDGDTFPAGVESDEGERPHEKLEDGQPGLIEDPPAAD